MADKYKPERMMAMLEQAKAMRGLREERFDQAMRYSMPGRGSFFQSTPEDEIDDIFDETAIVAVQEFASRLQAGIVPNFSRWAALEAGGDIPPDDREAVNRDLKEVTEYAFDILNYSNFSTEVYEAFLDLSVTLGCLEVEDGTAVEPIRFSAVPLNELWVNNGPYDRLDQFFRKREYTWDQFNVKYPDHSFPAAETEAFQMADKPYKFIEGTFRDWSKPNDEIYYRRIIWEGDTDKYVYKRTYTGVGSCPMIAFRWSKESGSVWGRGPMMNALPAVKSCNLVMQMVLENAQMNIAGMYNMDDDGVINPETVELVPGTIIPRSPGSRGLEPVQAAGNFNVSDLVLEDMRNNIRKTLYNDMLGNPNKTPMSATEVAERMADLSRQIGAAFGRLMFEMVIPTLQRTVYILKERGLIDLPTVNNREIVVTATSPLAQAQHQKDIQSIDRLVEWITVRFGPDVVKTFVKAEEASQYVADKLQVPENLTRTPEEVKEAGEQAAQLAQQMGVGPDQVAEQAGQGGPVPPGGAAMPGMPPMPGLGPEGEAGLAEPSAIAGVPIV